MRPFRDRMLLLQRGQAGVMHQTWVWSHGLLKKLHMALHMPLHMAMPNVFGRPAFLQAILGVGSFRYPFH